VADQAPQPEPSSIEKISLWLKQDEASTNDVSTETSPETEDGSELEVSADESDSEGGDPNAQVEGGEAEESEGIRTFAELAKSFELDEETLAKSLHVVGRDGKEVPLHEVLTAYRAPAPEAVEVEQLRAHRAEFEQGKAQLASEAEGLRQAAQAFAQQLKAREPNWAELKAADPVAFATARLEYIDHVRQLENADRQYQAARAREAADQERQFHEFRRDQARKLQAAVPEWSDVKVMQADLDAVTKYLVTQGIKPEEVENLTDHRDWLIARKAMAYDALQAKKPDLLKRVRQLPRMMAPGGSSGADRGAGARAAQEDGQLMERFRQTDVSRTRRRSSLGISRYRRSERQHARLHRGGDRRWPSCRVPESRSPRPARANRCRT
jgi:hypothetical protein